MEKKREITEEQVKEYQMLLAQWMQLPKDALEILNEDMPWRIREWLYVCALDQISGAELKTMKPQGLKKIQDIRAQFLKQKFQDRQEIQTQMNALQKQMEEGIEKQATALSRLQEEVLQVLQYLEQEKQILKEREEQLLEEQRKYKEQFQQMEQIGWKRRNRGVFGTGCGRKTEENTNVQETGTNGSICKTGVRRGEV